MNAQFDQYSHTYDEAWLKANRFMGKNHDFYTLAKVQHMLSVLRRHRGPPPDQLVLDVGCGIGKTIRFLKDHTRAVVGADISQASIERARAEHPSVRFEVFDGKRLPFHDESFDLAIIVCVLHHVPPEDRVALLLEIRRTLKPGGLLMAVEHNPFNPLTRLSVMRCEFDHDAQLLRRRTAKRLMKQAAMENVESRYFLVSPIAFPGCSALERALCQAPLGAQYYVVGRRPSPGSVLDN